MHTNSHKARCYSFMLVATLVLVLAIALSACGSNSNSNTGSSTVASPTATPIKTSSVSATGCLSGPPETAQPTSTIVLTNANSSTTINVKLGDTIEVDLPAGHQWQGPNINPPNLLNMQGPAGYTSAQDCVWHFTTVKTGEVSLSFTARPICKKNQMCPMYIMEVPFTINIQ